MIFEPVVELPATRHDGMDLRAAERLKRKLFFVGPRPNQFFPVKIHKSISLAPATVCLDVSVSLLDPGQLPFARMHFPAVYEYKSEVGRARPSCWNICETGGARDRGEPNRTIGGQADSRPQPSREAWRSRKPELL